jgi:type IV fimbrial biogenesis protein FimT
MVTVMVMVVVVTAAAPSLTSVRESMQLTSAANGFLSHLYFARSEAIKRNSRVVLCKSADGLACSSIGGWEQGWIIFHDANGNAVRDASETIIRREAALSYGLSLTGNQSVASYVSFVPTGATRLVSGAFQAGTLTVCTHSFQRGEARQIILNAIGRPRVQKSAVDFCT